MAGYYTVEREALAKLTQQLSECTDEMRSAMRLLKDIGPKGSGHADLEKACDDFQESWSYGIGLIADATSGVTEGLSTTGEMYAASEDAVAKSFQASREADGQ